MTRIADLVTAFTGHTLRGRMENNPDGDCAIIQAKDLTTSGSVQFRSAPYKIALNEIPPAQLLKKGDILVLSKGANNKALLYDAQFTHAAATSAFTVLRITTTQIKPAFLAWYINSPQAQEYFGSQRAGTTTLNLSKKAIEELPVPVPPLLKQELMIKLVKQHDLYSSLLEEYQSNLRLLVNNVLNSRLNDKTV
ncbi:MAG: restriction endonuclease subunit S [Chitinophagaceae bacterium]